jgi:hypothetical protein
MLFWLVNFDVFLAPGSEKFPLIFFLLETQGRKLLKQILNPTTALPCGKSCEIC